MNCKMYCKNFFDKKERCIMSSFENLRVVDNFYQTSLFFPMPTVVISTLCEDGSTTLGP